MKNGLRLIALLTAALASSLSWSASARENAQAIQSAAQLEVATNTSARPALWEVSDDDTTIYLFGTVHALPKGIDWFEGDIADAFQKSGELVTEVADADPARMQGAVMAKALLPDGQNLRDMLSPDDRAALEKAIARLGMPPASFDRFKPWYAAVALSALPLMRDGYSSENGVEAALDAQAKALKRPHSGLETAEYQLGIFDSLPAEAQKGYLREVVDTLPDIRKELDAMVVEWRKGNAAKLAELMNADEDDPQLMEVLLINRNKTWAQWIKGRLDKPGVVFMAVGAGHLAGDGSVQDQLKRLGITTSRVQ